MCGASRPDRLLCVGLLPWPQGLQPLDTGLEGETWTKGLDNLAAAAKEYKAAGVFLCARMSRACMHVCMCACVRACACVCICACMPSCVQCAHLCAHVLCECVCMQVFVSAGAGAHARVCGCACKCARRRSLAAEARAHAALCSSLPRIKHPLARFRPPLWARHASAFVIEPFRSTSQPILHGGLAMRACGRGEAERPASGLRAWCVPSGAHTSCSSSVPLTFQRKVKRTSQKFPEPTPLHARWRPTSRGHAQPKPSSSSLPCAQALLL